MKKYKLWTTFTCSVLVIFFLCSCSNKSYEIDPFKLEVVKKDGLFGLQSKEDGTLILKEEYKDLRVKRDHKLDEYYIEFKKPNGERGYYFDNLDKPTIQVDTQFRYLKLINSKRYFVFTKIDKKAPDGTFLEGVIDKNGKELISNDYRQILHDGGKMFYISTMENKMLRQFNLEKGQFNTPHYGMVYARFGGTFASKYRDGGGDIWGAVGCLLDQDGNEITDHIYQSVGFHKCLNDPSKVFARMRNSETGKFSLYYLDGKMIYDKAPKGVGILTDHFRKMYEKFLKTVSDKNLIGIFAKEGKTHFLTYEGEVLVKE